LNRRESRRTPLAPPPSILWACAGENPRCALPQVGARHLRHLSACVEESLSAWW